MKSVAHPELIVAIVAGAVAGGLAFAGEPPPVMVAQAEPTPFQAMPPLPMTPADAPSTAVESETIEGDPEQKARRRGMDRVERLEEFDRLDRDRTEQPGGVERVGRPEPATGIVRPEVARPEPIERPAIIERPEKVERAEKVERPEKAERRERLERVDRSGPGSGGRVERIDRSGRR